MKVIFLKDVPRVGKRHDIKEVNDGYALNFLFPNNLAKKATNDAVKSVEQMKKEVVIKREIQEGLLLKNLSELKDKVVLMKGKANEKGSLFSAIHKKEILEELLKQHQIEMAEESIILDKPIKELGEFSIFVKVANKNGEFKLKVISL